MDLNGDGKIGIKDLNMLLKGWNTTYASNKDTLKNDIVTNWGDLYVQSWKKYSYTEFYSLITSSQGTSQSWNNSSGSNYNTVLSTGKSANSISKFFLLRKASSTHFIVYNFTSGDSILKQSYANSSGWTTPNDEYWYFH